MAGDVGNVDVTKKTEKSDEYRTIPLKSRFVWLKKGNRVARVHRLHDVVATCGIISPRGRPGCRGEMMNSPKVPIFARLHDLYLRESYGRLALADGAAE